MVREILMLARSAGAVAAIAAVALVAGCGIKGPLKPPPGATALPPPPPAGVDTSSAIERRE